MMGQKDQVIGEINGYQIKLRIIHSKGIGRAYDDYSYPKLSSLIVNYRINGMIYILYSEKENKLYNIVIYSLLNDQKSIFLLSLWAPSYPNWYQDLLTTLQVGENIMKSQGISKVKMEYRTKYKTIELINAIQQDLRWSEPVIVSHFGLMQDLQPLLTSPWLNRRIPDHCEIEKWNDTSLNYIHSEIQKEKWNQGIPNSLHPLQLTQNIDPDTSFLLKYHNELAGWLICHRINDKRFQVTTLFVKDNQCRWMGLRMLREMVIQLNNSGRQHATVQYMMAADNHKMVTMTEKILVPLGVELHKILRIEKDLSA